MLTNSLCLMTTDKANKVSGRFRWRSFKYAFRGIATLFRTAPNARIHAVAAVLVVAAGFLFDISAGEWCIVILCIGAVIAAEAVNSAIEFLADRISSERHPLLKHAKDVAAAAVLILAITAVVEAAIIFIPKIIALIFPC